jgi:hypothetical protein
MKSRPSKKTVAGFTGLDLRRLPEMSDPKSLRVATNLDLTLGGELTARDALVKFATFHPQSKGLYAIGGTLRAVIPGGQGYPLDFVGPVRVHYDHLGGEVSDYTSITAGVTQGSDQIECIGSLWPTWSVGGTLTIRGGDYTITALSADRVYVTIGSPWADAALYSYPFSLQKGADVFQSSTASLDNGSNSVVLSGPGLPSDLRDSTISFPTTGFSSGITFRSEDVFLLLENGDNLLLESGDKIIASVAGIEVADVYDGSAMVDVPFTITNVPSVYAANTLVGVSSVESIGASADFGAYPYIVVERWVDPADHSKGTRYEHHWVRADAVSTTSPQATLVALPFVPGPSVVKMASKLWAIDDVSGVVRFCSTASGPADWEAEDDAGYIPVLTHASGDRRLRALGIYDEKLAVIFEDSVQLWIVDSNPSNIGIARNMVGPGTEAVRSIANVVGDLFYFTAGGFRSLSTQALTGQVQEQDDIGAKVFEATKTETAADGVALWSQKRGQYLCAFGTKVYAYRYSPKSGIVGWTTWDLGVEVDYLVENDGKLYIRSGNDGYVFDPNAVKTFAFDATFNEFTGDTVGNQKRYDFLELYQRGECDVQMTFDISRATDPLFEAVGTSVGAGRMLISGVSNSCALRFTGTGPWTLSAYAVQYTPCAW